MIRLFKLFMNVLYGVFTMGVIVLIVWTANFLVNTGGETSDVPNLVGNAVDELDKTIYFSDITDFNIVSILNAHASHEIFLGNEETGNEYIFWNLLPVGWLNRSLTWTKNVVVATLSPSYEMEQLDNYRYAFFVTVDPVMPNMYITIDSTDITPENYDGEEYNIFGIIYGSKSDSIEIGDSFTKEDILSNGSWWVFKQTTLSDFQFRNEVIKYVKYNGDDYQDFEKFLDNKTVVKWAFAEILIIFTLTIFVVYQNPIDFTRNARGVTEVDRGLMPRIPMPKRRERKYKKRDRKRN